ncbi:fasciclin-like arabinogalactan protein 2 [Andrographis paniculata]|uniref:fasciclin-like arabinogalactan protein 2 n=1 Tax=Andrographis paniculata TaxID=175694 RepID=UPI0021E72C33|nr:fasciclin-like arabinogalactan protein 2 [Andrographis paniculata]
MITMLIGILAVVVAIIAGAGEGHNITHLLAGHPSLSTFNHYLSTTHLADEINRRRTITVCALDNAAMDDLLSHHFSLPTLKNILSLHVFADYFGSRKLHQIPKGSATTSSLYQATGEAAGTSGYVNIVDAKGGKISFSAVDSNPDQPPATFVKSVVEMPYNISVIQISHALSSPEAEAPTAAPTDIHVVNLMAAQGCKGLSDLIVSMGAEETFRQSLEGGLTIFCPSDETLKSFMPKFKTLGAHEKTMLLLYHATPEYNSLGSLRSSDGLMNTVATAGSPNKYYLTVKNDGDNVKIDTQVVTATIKGTLIDEDPFAVYKIDKVLQPSELFKSAKAKAAASGGADAPGPAGDDDVPADEDSSNDGGIRVNRMAGGVALSCSLVLLLIFFELF